MPRLPTPKPRRRALLFPLWLAGVFLLVASTLVLARGALAWSLGDGVHILNGDDRLVVGTGTGIDVVTTLTFADDGAPILDGVTLDLEDSDTAATWTITQWSANRIVLTGTPSAGNTTFRVAGLAGDWRALGLVGEPLISVAGGPYAVSTGTIDLTRQGAALPAASSPSGASDSSSSSSSSSSGGGSKKPTVGGVVAIVDQDGDVFGIPPSMLLAGAGVLVVGLVLGKRRRTRRGMGAVILLAGLAFALYLFRDQIW